ncbi:MAG TPA: putative Ig domain-containing protein [Nocardioides sp.]|nr:putative Ig domain-containing protein [Nocardioides sp.]
MSLNSRANSVFSSRTRRSALTVLLLAALVLTGLGPVAAAAPGNEPPRIKAIPTTTAVVGHQLVLRPRATDPDGPRRALRFRLRNKPRWVAFSTKTGVLRGKAPQAAAGKRYRLELSVTDGRATRRERFTLRVVANRAPSVAAVADVVADAGAAVRVQPSATDPDGGPRDIAWVTTFVPANGRTPAVPPSWLTASATTGAVTGTAPGSAVGMAWQVTSQASDGLAATSASYRLTVRNQAPTLAPPGARTATIGSPFSVQLLGSDPDAAPRPVSYLADAGTLPGWLSLDRATGTVSGTPPPGSAGTYAARFRADDGLDTSAWEALALGVVREQAPDNRPPMVNDSTLEVREGPAGTKVGAVTGSDPDGDPLTWTLVGDGFSIDPTTGVVTATSALDRETTATHTLKVRASDGRLSDDATLTVKVTDVDESPVITKVADVTVIEDQALTPIAVEATDPEGKDVTIRVIGLPSGLTYDAATGTITGTPTRDGTTDVTVSANDGTSNPSAATFAIKVTAANDAPVITAQTFTVPEGTPVGTVVGTLAATDEETQRSGLAFTGGNADFTVSATGVVTVARTAATAAVGTKTFDATVDDGARQSSATITVEVGDVPHPPVIDDQQLEVAEDTAVGSVVGTVVATDADDDTIAFSVTAGNEAGRFAIDPATGKLALAGAVDFEDVTTYSLTVRATTGPDSDEATVTVKVTDVDEAPVITPIADVTAAEDKAITAIQVEASDPEGKPVTLSATGLPAGLRLDGTTIVGTPTVPGTSTVTVSASDGTTASAEELTITVTAVNDAPVLVAVDDATATEGQALAAITVVASDEEDGKPAITVSGLPNGVSYDAATGKISGTPTVGGTFSVTVTATDAAGDKASDTFVLTVTEVNDAPVAGDPSPATVQVTEGQAVDTTVLVPATDEEGGELTRAVTGLPAGMTGTGTSTGIELGGTPTEDGTYTATVTVSDGDGGEDTATFEVVVAAAPTTPCPKRSTLPCADIAVDLPVSLDFTGDEGGLDDTGFTMVDPPSLRAGVDQSPAPATPTYADAPGFEPGLLAAGGDQLTITATKGIMYRAPGQSPAATAPNAQLNALGVGVRGSATGYDLATTVVAPTFPGSSNGSQQGGLWFGLGEDDYVKAVVSRVSSTTNKVQLLREVGGVATPGTEYELNSSAFPSGQDVRLELQVVDTAGPGGQAQLHYTVGAGARTLLVDTANTVDTDAVPVAESFLTGTAVGGEAAQSFAGLFATKRNAAVGDVTPVTFGDFSAAVHEMPNTAPVVTPVADVAAVEGAALDPVTITAADAEGDEVTITSDLDVDGLVLTDNGDGTATLAGTPAAGTAAASPYDVVVTASDGRASGSRTVRIVVAEAGAPCLPITREPCSTVRVDTPYVLDFDGSQSGLAGTGFTMVDDPSARTNVDQAPAPATPSTPDVPGFEPGLLGQAAGNLRITATKGIAYRRPADSAGTNSQLNTLGVGLAGGTDGYELQTTVVDPTFPGATNGSQQGGLWFGLDEDNYVKLAVVRVSATTNKVQLVKEVGGIAQPATTYELNSATFPSGQRVRLVLQVDASGAQPVVRGSYAVGDGQLGALTDPANTAGSTQLPVPATFLDGTDLPSGAGGPVTFGGVYATKRGAPASDNVVVSFADFSAELIGGVVEPYTPLDVKVDFTSEAGTPAPGYLKDYGQPYGQRSGASQGGGEHVYGWVKENSEEELSLVGNGRVRGRTGVDPRLDSIIHMQFADVPNAACPPNVCQDGDWQLAVANGTYDVTVAVGDQPGATSYDSLHAVNVENSALIEGFTGSASAEFDTATTRVGVVDGELTINATGGTNTKLAYVEVRSASPTAADPLPFVVQTRPANRSLGAPLGEGVAADVHLVGTSAEPGPVDPATVTDATVRLFEVVPGSAPDVEVAGNRNTTGGGDSINFQQSGNLKATTTYRFVVDGVKDTTGRTFVPFRSLFTTGSGDVEPPDGTFDPVNGVDFQKVDLGKNGKYYASLVVHDGHLWATTIGQGMFRYPINVDGTLGAEQPINAFLGRAAVGFVFDRTDPDVAWVTHATANIGNESQAFGSKLSRVDFSSSVANPVISDVFVNLPRSQKDHLSNSISYGPGGRLYFLQGSNQAAGDPDGAWGDRGETLLTAAMLTFDPVTTWQRVQASGPVDVQTVDKGGSYDPFAASAPLKIYATGIRNAYDLVHASNGSLYVPTNGTASGGNSPGVTASGGTLTRTGQVPGGNVTSECASRRIDGTPYTAPSVPAVTNHNTQRDFLFDVEAGGYYGHPNPSRCEWVLNNGGNPEGAGSGGSKYPASVVPDRNYRGWAYDFEFNKSPNGVIEYRSNTFGGKLKGRLMVVRFSNFDDVFTLEAAANGQIEGGQAGSTIGGFSGFDDPLDIVEDLDTGNLYVNSYDQSSGQPRLYLLRVPDGQGGADVSVSTRRLVGNQVTSAGSRTLGTVTVTNEGSEATTVTGATISGTGAAAYTRTPSTPLPATLAPGASMTVQVSFDPSTEGVAPASLGLTLSAGSAPTVSLRGLGTDGLGGSAEPSLQYVFDAWELGIDTGDDNDATNEIHSSSSERVSPTLGDSIDVETFTRFADGPVTVEPISVFGPTDSAPVTEVSWYDDAAPATRNALFSVSNSPASNGQTLTPTTTGALQLDPGQSTFGFVSRWPFFANRLVHTQDSLNTFAGAIGNHVRVYPLVEGGQPVPHAYVVATEEHTSGFDFNDVVFIVRNVEPAGGTQPPGQTIRVNFQSETAPVPAGHLRDFGQAYGPRTLADQGGLTYGWRNATTLAPEARTTSGRERNLNSDQRLDTFMHMQYQQQSAPNCTANNCNTGTWGLAIGDGTYQVTAAVGDPAANSDPEAHQVRVEGVPLLAAPHVPSGPAGSPGHHATGTQVVTVSDGELTLDAVGGTNSKIDYIEVSPVTGGGGETVAQVSFQPATSPTPSGWSADSGQLFTEARGYGWVRTEGGATKTADTRARTQDPDPLTSTLMIVDDTQVAGVVDGEWELAVADGTYTVSVSVGDAGFADSSHGLAAEGVPLVSGFVPTGPGDYRVATASVDVTDGRLTLASTGSNTKVQWVSVASGSDVDVIPPTVDLSVTGVTGPGGYVTKATVVADVVDRGGSGTEFVDWTLDGADVPRPAGDRLEVTGLGAHTVTVTATDAAGNDTTATRTFTIVDGSVAAIAIANQDAQRVAGAVVPGMAEDFLVMHHLNNRTTSTPTHAAALTHDTATLRISNTDPDDPLVVTGLGLSAPMDPTPGVRASTTSFTTPGTTLPLTVAPGGTYDLRVQFGGAGSRGAYGATMTITSNAANRPELPVQLRGYWQPQPEGGVEPTMTDVARVFGYSTAIGEPLEDAYDGPLQGDEVRSLLWKRLDPSRPVTARQLTALHGCCGETGDNISSPVSGSHDGAWGQSFYPRVAQNGTAPASAPFQQGQANPSGTFPLTIAGYTTNKAPTATDPANLGIRVWPVEIGGRTVPGAYLVGQDFVQNGCGGGSANCDYQDNVFLMTNIAPVASADTTGPASAPTGVSASVEGNDVRIAWNAVTAADLGGYVVERQAAGSTTWTRVNGTPVAGLSLVDTTAPGSTQVTYRVLAVDTSQNASAPSTTASVTTPPRPQAAIRVNAGGPAVTTGGVAWGAQQYGTGGKTYTNAVAIAGTTDDVLYQSEYSTATGAIDYDIPVQNGAYTVRLHFAEIYFGAPGGGPGGVGRRIFDVALEGQLRLDNYDIVADVGSATAVVKSYTVQVTDGKVDVDLDSVVDQAKISAIEVLPAG